MGMAHGGPKDGPIGCGCGMTGSDLHFTMAPLAAAWGKNGGPEENQGDTPGTRDAQVGILVAERRGRI